MHLLRLDASLENRWDDYVGERTSTVTDLSGWRQVVRETYGIRSHFIAVEDNDELIGTLGLFEIKHPLFGHYLTTAVFATDGGLYYDSDIARDLLIEEAKRQNADAFAALYDKYKKEIFNYLVRFLNGNRKDAEEVLQETFLDIYQQIICGL